MMTHFYNKDDTFESNNWYRIKSILTHALLCFHNIYHALIAYNSYQYRRQFLLFFVQLCEV